MLKPQLHKVHTSLKLNSEVTATNVDILNTLLYDIRIKIKLEDPLFRRLFKRLEYTGSYYDGLRTKMADEFDINLVLDLPFRKDEFTVLDGCPGYVGYGVNPAAKDRLIREEDTKWVQLLLKWMDGENRLLPDKVKRWLQSAFDRVLRTYVIPSGSCSAVDKDCNWFLIPKAPEQKSHLWRLHFPNMEKRLIEDYGCVKPIIRLLKVLDFLAHVLAQPGPAISFLFHPELDLTERVTRETRDNISCRIKRIVRKLRLSPDQCYELVLKNHRKGQALTSMSQFRR
ncbi:conserved hypothetical protein [Ixodes scapularis]|uniref:Mab-21-like nucleotidyltransferase domain-containing protein n=1 Tax=Ixodes scapularis TaxID=6945 RepID=B7PLM5_IXOSC|nr:conserved hypothetical protein [Ixodes scapularis]|eukprot:XP_002434673.1 conserved hypothetical protein [Ixodes scapularis]